MEGLVKSNILYPEIDETQKNSSQQSIIVLLK